MREIRLTFKGIIYTIPDSRAFQIGEQVEEILCLADIAQWQQKPRMFKLARAVGAMLRFAGARVRDEDVFADMTSGDDPLAAQARAADAMSALISLLTGGAQGEAGGEPPEKITAL